MCEFIVCSDNHGLITPLERLEKTYPNIKTKIHCGDIELPHEYVKYFEAVTGNNDYFHHYPEELVVDVGDFKIFVTHGHQFYGNRLKKLAKRAINHHCQVACFGHTHVFEAKMVEGVLCLNPGSLRYNRDGSKPSYAHVTFNDGKFKVTRRLVEDLEDVD